MGSSDDMKSKILNSAFIKKNSKLLETPDQPIGNFTYQKALLIYFWTVVTFPKNAKLIVTNKTI